VVVGVDDVTPSGVRRVFDPGDVRMVQIERG
jgi:hypothetical protein